MQHPILEDWGRAATKAVEAAAEGDDDQQLALLVSHGEGDQLRRLVLELAVRGRLVAPDLAQPRPHIVSASSSPSSAGRRARSREDELKPPAAEEHPFDIPENWVWARVNDTGEYINGLAFKPSDWGTDGYPIIRIQNLTDPTKPINRCARMFDDAYIVRTGDLLVSWSATLDVFIWDREPGVLNQHIFRVLPREDVVLSRFLFHALRHCIRDMENSEHTHGLVMKHINRGPFLAHPIPIPPLVEQKRIVAKVDELMRLISDLEAKQRKRREVRARFRAAALCALTSAQVPTEFDVAWTRVVGNFAALFEDSDSIVDLRGAIRNLAIMGMLSERDATEESAATLLDGILQEREQRIRRGELRQPEPLPPVEPQFPIPATWAWTRLGALCLKVADGPHFSPKYVQKGEGVPFLSGRNIRVAGFELESVKYVSPSDHATFIARVKPEQGDVLYTKGGTTGVALVNTLPFDFSVWVHVAVLKLDQVRVFPPYVAMALNSPHCYAQSQRLTHGTGNRDLGLTRMIMITMPLPPLPEQKRIVAKVEHLMKLCDDLEAKLQGCEEKASKLVAAVVSELVA